jgi:hypothetical protein
MPETKGLSLLQIREMYLGKHTKTISIPVFKDVDNKDDKAKTISIPVFKDAENKDAKAKTKANDEDDEKQDMLTSSV